MYYLKQICCSLSKDLPLGLLTFSDTANVRIPYNTTDLCQVLKTIATLPRSSKSNQMYYNKALVTVEDEILKSGRDERCLIVLLVDKKHDGENNNHLTMSIKSNDVLVVGVTGGKFILDMERVAGIGRTFVKYSMKVKEYDALKTIAFQLLEYTFLNFRECPKDLSIIPEFRKEVENSKHYSKRDIDVMQLDVSYLIIKNYVQYEEALTQCIYKYGGSLIEGAIINKIKLKHFLKQYNIQTMWVQSTANCTIIDTYTEQTVIDDCQEKHRFVCRIECKTPVSNRQRTKIVKSLSHSCKQEEILLGPPKFMCDKHKGGWLTNYHRLTPLPVCISAEQFADRIAHILNRTIVSILFALDESVSISKEQFKTQIKLIENIVLLYPASKSTRYGLITYSVTSKLRVPYKSDDSCKFVKNLKSFRRNPGGMANYELAVKLIDQQIRQFGTYKLTLVFFITNGIHRETFLPLKNTIDALRRHVEIFVMKIGQSDSNIASEIPTRDDEYNINVFNVHNHRMLNRIIDTFREEANRKPLKCK